MEEEKRPPEQGSEQPPERQSAQTPEQAAERPSGQADKKRPRNIVTDFYDSLNISVRQLDFALVVLCAFILLVIIFASKTGL